MQLCRTVIIAEESRTHTVLSGKYLHLLQRKYSQYLILLRIFSLHLRNICSRKTAQHPPALNFLMDFVKASRSKIRILQGEIWRKTRKILAARRSHTKAGSNRFWHADFSNPCISSFGHISHMPCRKSLGDLKNLLCQNCLHLTVNAFLMDCVKANRSKIIILRGEHLRKTRKCITVRLFDSASVWLKVRLSSAILYRIFAFFARGERKILYIFAQVC